ncbi:MAG TPA: BTAD domain-containing putative transcriptional regulator [Fimbriimonadaceae bacterium]|nr:BTAD domain-containing putative transcriptional regulator [Fimbriimonadaceae bacterium]
MSTPAPDYHLFLLGRAELLAPEGSVARFPTQKVLVLLAVLALAGEPVSRDALAQKVWPESPRRQGRDSLRTALASLRKVLPAGAVLAKDDLIWLREGAIRCDVMEGAPQPALGEFMPGIDGEWVVDQRLRLRHESVTALISEARAAWSQDVTDLALDLASKALEVDPLSEDAAALQVQLLDQTGRTAKAAEVSDAYRARILRDLGVVSDVRPSSKSEEKHPLAAAAEWLLDHDPSQVAGMIASTHEQWVGMAVEPALQIHERALAASLLPSPARRLVEAQAMYFLVLAGRLGARLVEADRALEEAIAAGEPIAAARLAGALAYGHLSRGEFAKCLHYAEWSRALALKAQDPALSNEFDCQLGIIRQQVGVPSAQRLISKCADLAGDQQSLPVYASTRLGLADSLIESGKTAQAAIVIETARRLFESMGHLRMVPWVILLESRLCGATGDNEKSRQKLEDIKRIGAQVAGHAVLSMADDELASVHCRLGEYDEAAEHLARASIGRKKLGTVASIYERNKVLPAKRALRERLDRRDLQAAYRRVADSLV